MFRKIGSVFPYLFYTFIIVMVLLLFYRFTVQNDKRIREQNRIYAEDAAIQTAKRVDDTLANSLDLIEQYARFLSFSLKDAMVPAELIREVEQNSPFNTVRFSDLHGVNYSGDGAVNNVSDREFFKDGLKGNSGVSLIFDSIQYGQTVLAFYAPVQFAGKVIGVLRGTYLADSYLREMLEASYFGKSPQIFLCAMNGDIIANSSSVNYSGNIIDTLIKYNLLESSRADAIRKTFVPSSGNLFASTVEGIADNICIVHLPAFNYLLVQAFPAGVSSAMIREANLSGIELELSLLLLFVCLAAWMLLRARQQKKALLQENRFFSTIVRGMSSVFEPNYGIADLETGEYTKIMGANLVNFSGKTESCDYLKCLHDQTAFFKTDEGRKEFLKFFAKDALAQALADNAYVIFQCHILRDGHEFWENIIAVCLDRKENSATRILFLRQDITDVKRRELQTRRQLAVMNRKERQYRLALTSNALCNYEFNVSRDLLEEDIIEIRNGKALSTLRPKGLVAPCKISHCFTAWAADILPDSRDEYIKCTNLPFLLECFESGQKELDFDYWRMDASGEEKCIRQAIYLTRDTMSGDIMAMTTTRDITSQLINQRKQTLALQDALAQAQRASEAKSTFLSNMSHDIRTPMNAIIGFASIAASHLDNRQQVGDCLQKVLSSSTHLLNLINDILDMSRIESGKLQLKIQECNISEIMHSLLNIIQPHVKAKQLRLFVDVFEIESEHVMADPLKLNQIFINLLGNAVKYTPAGGTIRFSVRQKESLKEDCADYVFTVNDNGIGMSKEFVSHIFEPFERESTTTLSGIQGTGLGMTITKNLVEKMNGSIVIDSTPGIGSTFTVTLPMLLYDGIVDEQKDLSSIKGLKILLVDDDFHICESAARMLGKMGLRTEWTTNGKEAISKTKMALENGDPYDSYIIDWRMPGMNGIEMSKTLRKLVGNDAPIIVISAYEWVDIEDEALAAGVTAFCAKPLFMSDLKNVLLSTHNAKIQKLESESQNKELLFKGKRILLVDDLEMNREMAEFILTENGFLVETAPDGTDAVAMVSKAPENYYDAILMDVQMPTMNGYEATRSIRNLPRLDVENMPIIAMTANALEDDREAALKSGMNTHISKPIDIENFFLVLRKYLHVQDQ